MSIFKEIGAKRYIVKYLQGVNEVSHPSTGCTLVGFKEGVNVDIVMKKKLTIPWSDILDIKAETQGEIVEHINMGATAVGYLFFGPIGAILGASKRKKDNRSLYLTIYYQDNNKKQYALIVETKQAYIIFNEFFNKWEKFCQNNEINIKQLKSLLKLEVNDELQILNQQKTKGLISPSEYEAKAKMLSQ